MIKQGTLPRGFVVTAIALLAFLALVHVILAMTGETGFSEFLLPKHPLVTGRTFDPVMFPSQGKTTYLEVIELCSGPAVRGMALFTLGAEFAMMALAVIILSVTRITLARCFLVVPIGVTGFALGFTMAANQRKAGLTVIKADFFPALCHVTIITLFTETTLVAIIFSMTGVAVSRRRTKRFSPRMAVGALDPRTHVRAGQREICPLVVKGFIVQHHYFRFASLVFGMAITTGVVPNAPVITGLVLYIHSNILMVVTIQTKLVLSATLERLVAGLALVLKLGMTLDQVARGNHGIERAHVCL